MTGTHPYPFGRISVALRRQKGLTQDELAARMDTTKRMISYFERHSKNPGLATVERLATALGVPKEKLLEDGGSEEEEKTELAVRSRMLQRAWRDAARLPLRDQQYLAKLIQGLVEQNGLKPKLGGKRLGPVGPQTLA